MHIRFRRKETNQTKYRKGHNENLYIARGDHTQYPEEIHICASILKDKIVRPMFLN